LSSKAQDIFIVAGPTASGKSARALELANQHDGVIVNCDSIQIYEGLPLLSAQPLAEDLAAAPHEFYGILHPNEMCSAGHWRDMVLPLLHDILARGQTPIIAGGSGLYIKALTEGLSPMPDIPDEIRAKAITMQIESAAADIHADLQARDPVMAERLDPNNTARLVRAWEVLEATGKSLSEWQKLPKQKPPEHWSFITEIIIPERDVLYQRCNDRFLWMLDNGAWDEAQAFSKRVESGDVTDGVPATKALGYKQLMACLRGEMSEEDTIERAQAETRHYAKRQVTWFRNQM
jgi:tRNA dimethylallyltransferase